MTAYAIVGMYLLALVSTVEYYQRARIQRPPLGHFNWRDVLFGLGFIVLMPFFYLALPVAGVTALFALFWAMLLYSALSPFLRRFPFIVAILIVVAQYFLRSPWLADAAVIIIAACVGTTFVKNGLNSREVAAFAVLLMVYDIVFTRFAGLMMPLMQKLMEQPYFIGLVIPGNAMLGGGDVALSAVFVADMTRHFGRRGGYLTAVLLVLPMFVLPFLGPAWRTTGIPYLMFASPVYLAVRGVSGVLKARRTLAAVSPAPTPTAAPPRTRR